MEWSIEHYASTNYVLTHILTKTFLKVSCNVAYQTKGNGAYRAPCKHVFCPYTQGQNIFSECGYVAYQMGLDARKPVCRFAKNKGADQPAHPRSLISALVIRLYESIISRLATSEISIF